MKSALKIILCVMVLAILLGLIVFDIERIKNKTRETEQPIAEDSNISENEVSIKEGKIVNERLIDEFLENIVNRKDCSLIINSERDRYVIEHFIGSNDRIYNEALEKAGGDKSKVESILEYNLPFQSGEEGEAVQNRIIYGFYKIVKNNEEPILLDSLSNVLQRKTNMEALESIDNGIVTLYIDKPYADVISNYEICKYNLNSSNYTRKFDLKFLRRKDMGIKRITNDEEYNLYTLSGDVYIEKNNVEYSLEDAINQGVISKEEIYNQALMDLKYGLCSSDAYYDGGSQEFYYPQLSQKHEGYTVLKMRTLDANKDLYIGMPGQILKYVNK